MRSVDVSGPDGKSVQKQLSVSYGQVRSLFKFFRAVLNKKPKSRIRDKSHELPKLSPAEEKEIEDKIMKELDDTPFKP